MAIMSLNEADCPSSDSFFIWAIASTIITEGKCSDSNAKKRHFLRGIVFIP